jgi:transcriptional regulator with XRE-family HTH domain
MDHRAEISEFLASRRARISPQSVGLPVAGRKRRVPGLRREEVAALAGLSVDYYIRLERGALTNASDSVLQAIARALQLDPAEQAHLVDLARAGRPSAAARPRRTPPATIAPQLQTVLDALVGVPALVRSPTLDLIATNSLARALYSPLYTDPGQRPNVARFTFLDPYARQFWPDWDHVADDLVAHLRAAADPLDPALPALVGELSTRSDAFRGLWARHDVRAHARGVKHFRHPVVGPLTLHYDHLQLTAEPALTMITYTAEPGTASHDNLALLASWAASAGGDGDAERDQSAPSRRGGAGSG